MSTKIYLFSLVVIILNTNAFTQSKCKILSFSRISINILPSVEKFSEVETEMIDILKNRLQSTNLQFVNDESESDFKFLIKVKPTNEEDELIATLVIMEKIPEEIIEIGAKEEALYSVIGLEKPNELTEEGKEIRKMMSREYMQGFGMIYNCYLEKIKRTEVEKFCEEIIKSFLSTGKKQ